MQQDFDAVVIGSGPNGLSAAITLQQDGLSVLLIEGKDTIGGGLRTAELTLPGFLHDVCSAIHPMAAISPFLSSLPLAQHGLKLIYPEVAAAHPLDDGSAAVLKKSLEETALSLGSDANTYLQLMRPVVADFSSLVPDILGPLRFPKHPLIMARFGLDALTSAMHLAKRFHTPQARGLWAGMAAHAIQPLSNLTSSAIALVLLASAHAQGWPVPKGGSVAIAKALASYFISIGGKIETGTYVRTFSQLPAAPALIFDVTPRQLLEIAGDRFSALYKWQLQRSRYGMVFLKIDGARDGLIPFPAPACRQAGTVHLGNTLEEIAADELASYRGLHPKKPFVLLAQQSLFDTSRAPEGKHTAWAYCHVPHGSKADMTTIIE